MVPCVRYKMRTTHLDAGIQKAPEPVAHDACLGAKQDGDKLASKHPIACIGKRRLIMQAVPLEESARHYTRVN